MTVATALLILAAVAVLTLVAAVEQLLDRLQQLGDFLHHVSVAAAVLRALALTVAEKGAKRANTHRHVCVSCIAGGTPSLFRHARDAHEVQGALHSVVDGSR
jgi:hypothetical protein